MESNTNKQIKFEIIKPKLRIKSHYQLIVLAGIIIAYYLYKIIKDRSILDLFQRPGSFFYHMFSFFIIRVLILFLAIGIIGALLDKIGLRFLIEKLESFFFDFSLDTVPVEKKASSSIEKLPIDKITENMDSIRKKESEEYINKGVPEIKEVYMPTDEQYEYLQKEADEILESMKNRIEQSAKIPQEHPLRNLVGKENVTIEEIINSSIEYMGYRESKYDLSLIKSAQNYDQLLNRIKPYIDEKVNVKDIKKDIQEPHTYLFKDLMKQMFGQLKSSWKGHIGEERVTEHLELFKDVIINIPNVRFELEDTSIEADNVVVTDKGIFCIETKNYGREGETILITKDGLWKRYDGDHEIPMKNVTEQHNRHLGIMQRFINNELKKMGFEIPYVYFEEIYVIANDEVAINNMSEFKVVRPSSVYNTIRNTITNIKLSRDVQLAICKIIEENRAELKKYPVKSYKENFLFYFDNLISWVENRYTKYDHMDLYLDSIIALGKKICLYETGTRNYYGRVQPVRYITIE